ncbi:hypothetical protein FMUND_1803 [Fusarium mundagurra]|uniref:Pesticidal crystal protein N-terminal domain-containing protein n=1 Tax=Fusarium mundagurra TaxID=1567541 RepID=A0A8H6DNI5_9HYPO|nr:hypothetical protein FMUND_1803 [Fusarium mundagurra]
MGKPEFPDQSIGGNSAQYENLFDETFTAKRVNSALKSTTSVGVKFVPYVGSLLSGLVSALWPDVKDKTLLWEDLESKVKAVALDLINANNSERMRDTTEGLYNVMRAYLDQASGTVEKGQYFTNLLTALAHDQPLYVNDKAPWNNLAYFASIGTLHLSVLREQTLFYNEIYGHDDPQATKHQQDLEDTVKKYLTARNKIVAKCLEYHREQIVEDWHKKNSGYWNANALHYRNHLRNVNELFQWDDMDLLGSYKFKCRKKQFESWIDTGYRAQVEAILSPSFSWPLYLSSPQAGYATENPASVDEGQVGNTTVRRLVMDYPGWMGDGSNNSIGQDRAYFNHEEMYRKYGPITKIIVHGGDRLDGLEFWYGNQQTELRGHRTGSQHETLELGTGEMITGVSAIGGSDVLRALKLSTTKGNGKTGQTIEVVGRMINIAETGWDYTFDGHKGGLEGDETKRLLWFCGYSYGSGGPWIYRLQPVFGHYQTWGPLQ